MPQKPKILVVDDDAHISELISLYLNNEGYETKEAADGMVALQVFPVFSPYLVLLDIMLPGMDGYQVLAELRKISKVPVIMLTAKGETFDKVLGLELGADDYIVKPFEPKELVARVKAVLRRYISVEENKTQRPVVVPNMTVNPANYTVTYHGQDLELPPKEFELLYYLASHPNQSFTRDQLLDKVWGYEYFGDSRTIDAHMTRLRKKLNKEDVFTLRTVWTVGYMFEMK